MSELCFEHKFPTPGLACIACWQKEKIESLKQELSSCLHNIQVMDRGIGLMKKDLLESQAREMRLRKGLDRIATLYHRAGKENIWEAMREIAVEALKPAPPIVEVLDRVRNNLENVDAAFTDSDMNKSTVHLEALEALAALQSLRGSKSED